MAGQYLGTVLHPAYSSPIAFRTFSIAAYCCTDLCAAHDGGGRRCRRRRRRRRRRLRRRSCRGAGLGAAAVFSPRTRHLSRPLRVQFPRGTLVEHLEFPMTRGAREWRSAQDGRNSSGWARESPLVQRLMMRQRLHPASF